MERITWGEYKTRLSSLDGFRITHYSKLFNAGHCRVEIDGRDFQLAWDDRYTAKEWNNQVNQFKKDHLSKFVEITEEVCEEIKSTLENYRAELVSVQDLLSTGLSGYEYNGAIAKKCNLEKMIVIYNRIVSMLPSFDEHEAEEIKQEQNMQLIPNIGLAKFKLHPTKKAQENPITCILAHNVEVFYTVTPERMKELLIAERMLDQIKHDNAILRS